MSKPKAQSFLKRFHLSWRTFFLKDTVEKELLVRISVELCNFFFNFLMFLGIILLFLNRKLNFDRNISTAIFHVHELLGFLIPIFGAIIADSWLGIYKTIKWMSLVFAVGSLIVSVCAVEALNLPT